MGRGFVDSVSSIFISIKSVLQNVGSFIRENKNLIAKPILGAIGQLVATEISKGLPALISHIINRNFF